MLVKNLRLHLFFKCIHIRKLDNQISKFFSSSELVQGREALLMISAAYDNMSVASQRVLVQS